MDGELLDAVQERMDLGQVPQAMDDLFLGLRRERLTSNREHWSSYVQSMCLTHPLRAHLHQDPITKRAFSKPRGYAGDAVTLDMIYEPESVDLTGVSERGRSIFEYTSAAPASESVRTRRDVIARVIDELADEVPAARVASVACGHVREAESSLAIRKNRLGRLFAIDQDTESLRQVERCYGGGCVQPVEGSVRNILRGRLRYEGLDLVYSAGLYDYLTQDTAQALTRRLLDWVKPGGHLVIANFLPAIRDIGYMESYMGWNLIFRTEAEMIDLLSPIPRRVYDPAEVFVDDQENVVFLRVTKRE